MTDTFTLINVSIYYFISYIDIFGSPTLYGIPPGHFTTLSVTLNPEFAHVCDAAVGGGISLDNENVDWKKFHLYILVVVTNDHTRRDHLLCLGKTLRVTKEGPVRWRIKIQILSYYLLYAIMEWTTKNKVSLLLHPTYIKPEDTFICY